MTHLASTTIQSYHDTAAKITPMIDTRYLLGEAADAMAYAEEGHPRAKVVITFQ